MVTYRDATPRDADTMSRIGKQTFTETFGHLYSAENLAAFLENHAPDKWAGELSDSRYRIRLAEENGEVAGFCKLGPASLPFEVSEPTAELKQLYVLAPWHGTGIAASLMNWALDTARTGGAAQMMLSVFIDNHRARRFYARYGFEQVGTYDFMVGTHADRDLIMRVRL